MEEAGEQLVLPQAEQEELLPEAMEAALAAQGATEPHLLLVGEAVRAGTLLLAVLAVQVEALPVELVEQVGQQVAGLMRGQRTLLAPVEA